MEAKALPKSRSLKSNFVRTHARKNLQSAVNNLQAALRVMESYVEKLEAAGSDSERAWVMNCAIEHLVCNLQPNLRIDLLASSQAELAVLGG